MFQVTPVNRAVTDAHTGPTEAKAFTCPGSPTASHMPMLTMPPADGDGLMSTAGRGMCAWAEETAASMTTCGSMAASCAAHRNEVAEPSHRTTYSCSVPAPPAVAAGNRLAASRYTGPLDCSDHRRSVHCAASAAAQAHRGRSAAAPSSVTDAVAVPPVLAYAVTSPEPLALPLAPPC